MSGMLELTAAFGDRVSQLLKNCRERGVEMRPFEFLRHPLVQGKYWKQSRPAAEIAARITDLRDQGAHFLAQCLEKSTAGTGPAITNALPGYSWHQWGEAIDCCWMMEGVVIWDTDKKVNGVNGYQVYAEEAIKLELYPGLYWDNFKDGVHVQFRKEMSPAGIYSIREINDIMEATFGD